MAYNFRLGTLQRELRRCAGVVEMDVCDNEVVDLVGSNAALLERFKQQRQRLCGQWACATPSSHVVGVVVDKSGAVALVEQVRGAVAVRARVVAVDRANRVQGA